MIRNVFKYLWIIQEVKNSKTKKRGRGYSTAVRMNPYNPLSYVSLVIIILVGIIMFGVVGFWKEIDNRNPFKWN